MPHTGVMLLTDVNILVYAFRPDSPDHERFSSWLGEVVDSDEAFGLADLVCSGFLRIVTHPRIFRDPAPFSVALDFIETIREQPNCAIIGPGTRHWSIFTELCKVSAARGGLVADAYHAALAIESGSEWITTDGDFARFPGLRWRRPFAAS